MIIFYSNKTLNGVPCFEVIICYNVTKERILLWHFRLRSLVGFFFYVSFNKRQFTIRIKTNLISLNCFITHHLLSQRVRRFQLRVLACCLWRVNCYNESRRRKFHRHFMLIRPVAFFFYLKRTIDKQIRRMARIIKRSSFNCFIDITPLSVSDCGTSFRVLTTLLCRRHNENRVRKLPIGYGSLFLFGDNARFDLF